MEKSFHLTVLLLMIQFVKMMSALFRYEGIMDKVMVLSRVIRGGSFISEAKENCPGRTPISNSSEPRIQCFYQKVLTRVFPTRTIWNKKPVGTLKVLPESGKTF